MPPYTLLVTSCNRHDLLRRTLESFAACADSAPRKTVVLEDGALPAPEWFTRLKDMGEKVWIQNGERMGQLYSCDRLWGEAQTEYVFWCEDDWEFTQQGFLQRSFEILARHAHILMVALRTDWNHPLVDGPKGGGFQIAEPYWGGNWGGLAFNPGLRRKSDYTRLGSYGRHVAYGREGLADESALSKLYLDLGYRIAALPEHCHHIGGGRSRAVEKLERKLPKILIAVPACWEFDYSRWESAESPHYDPKHEAYGTDIHISGSNPRLAAVRDTWWNDIKPFAHHVEGRFFYGVPAARAPLADEVVLNDCADDYGALPVKVRSIFRWALDNDYDFVLKCDDDSYLWPSRLVAEVLKHRFDYAGYVNGGDICSGGCGYFLSRRGMRAVVDHGNPTSWAEDVNTGHAMNNARIKPFALEGHVPGFSAHWFDINTVTDKMACIHAVKPEDMRTLYRRENSNG